MKSNRLASSALAATILLITVAAGWLFLHPGVFSVDESHYLLAAQAAARGSFAIENGFEKTGDPSLLYFYTVVPEEVEKRGSIATVPPYHSFLAGLFLALGDTAGVIWLNLLAFLASALAVRRLGRRLGASPALANLIMFLFVTGGMSFEYALGIWPHALAQCLALWMLVFFLDGRNKLMLFFFSGLLGGLGVGVRLQQIVWLVALSTSWLFLGREKLRALAAWLTGWAIPLAGLGAINYLRLGSFNPFTYGKGLGQIAAFNWLVRGWPWLLAAAACFLLFWLFFSVPTKANEKKRDFRPFWAAAAGAAMFLFIPGLREIFFDYLGRLGFFLVDPALASERFHSQGAVIGAWGQEYFGGMLKKGLLEVMPFAALALSSFLHIPDGVTDRLAYQRLALAALASVALLPLILSPGGFCYNPRYLLEVAPLLLLLAAFQLQDLPRPFWLAGCLAGIALSLPTVLEPAAVDQPQEGKFLLLTGLTLSLGGLAAGFWRLFSTKHHYMALATAAFIHSAALSYGAMIQLGVDTTRSVFIRQTAYAMCRAAADVLPEKAALIAWEARKDVFTPLKLKKDLWIAAWRRDDPRPPDIIDLQIGRPLFILRNGIPEDRWNALASRLHFHQHKKGDLLFYEVVSAP